VRHNDAMTEPLASAEPAALGWPDGLGERAPYVTDVSRETSTGLGWPEDPA